MFFCEFCEISRNIFFHRTRVVAASGNLNAIVSLRILWLCSTGVIYCSSVFLDDLEYILFTGLVAAISWYFIKNYFALTRIWPSFHLGKSIQSKYKKRQRSFFVFLLCCVFSLVVFCVNILKAYLEPSQTSKMELFAAFCENS